MRERLLEDAEKVGLSSENSFRSAVDGALLTDYGPARPSHLIRDTFAIRPPAFQLSTISQEMVPASSHTHGLRFIGF